MFQTHTATRHDTHDDKSHKTVSDIFGLCSGLPSGWIGWWLVSTPKAHKSFALLTLLFNTSHVSVDYTIIVLDEL